jgi:hypothetical protein
VNVLNTHVADAAFSQRITNETAVEVIGGSEKYVAACRECFFKYSKGPETPSAVLVCVDDTNKSIVCGRFRFTVISVIDSRLLTPLHMQVPSQCLIESDSRRELFPSESGLKLSI